MRSVQWKLGVNVSGKSVWRSTTVHDGAGRVFCKRIERALTDKQQVLEEGASECEDMRGLATAVRMLAEDGTCSRVMIPVGIGSVEDSGSRFADAMMGMPLELRSKILVEIKMRGDRVNKRCAEFAESLQMGAGVSVVAWVEWERTEFAVEVMEVLSPAILGIEVGRLREAVSAADRSTYIDTVEAASLGGAMVLAGGVDSKRDLLSVQEIGVELVHGRWLQKTSYVEEEAGYGKPGVPLQRERRRREFGWPDAYA